MQGAVAFDGETGYAAVDQRDGARLELAAVGRDVLVDDDLGVTEVGHYRLDRTAAGDDQHRQGEYAAKVRIRKPHGGKGTRSGHEHPGRAGGSQLTRQLSGVAGVGRLEHRSREDVVVRPAQRNAGIGQVGVDLEVAVAGVLGGAAGGGHPGPHQCHHQVTGHLRGVGRCDDLGHRHRPGLSTDPDTRGRGQPEPAVRGVVQRPRVVRRIDRAILAGFVVVH